MAFHRKGRKRLTVDRAVTLIESMIAVMILMVGIVSVMSMFSVAVGQNRNQGDLATRTTEYAQDKLEQLLALNFADGSTDTTVSPPASTGGTGLGGSMAPSLTVGSVDPTAPVSQYVDYLDPNGKVLPGSTGSLFTRQWSIATDSTGSLKTITVFAIAYSPKGLGLAPSTTLVCLKSKR